MKKIVQLICLMLIGATAYAQFPLPYKTGWDNNQQQYGWKKFRKGNTGSSEWVVSNDAPAPIPSSPNCVKHDYPLGGTTSLVEDWYVSPRLNLSAGGVISSLQIMLYAPGGTNFNDHFGVYLLSGDSDPATAGVTQLADYTSFASPFAAWTAAPSVSIPPTAGVAYIGFKYTGQDDQFAAYMDKLEITKVPAPPPPPGECDTIDAVLVYNITGNSAQVRWEEVDGVAGYEFAVSEFEENPTTSKFTTLLSQNAIDLQAEKKYYAYVRTQCNTTDFSKWKSASFVTKKATGIDDVTEASIHVYPNPASNVINLEGITTGATIQINDMTGKVLDSKQSVQGNTQIDITRLPAGMYYLRVLDSEKTLVRKFIKE